MAFFVKIVHQLIANDLQMICQLLPRFWFGGQLEQWFPTAEMRTAAGTHALTGHKIFFKVRNIGLKLN